MISRLVRTSAASLSLALLSSCGGTDPFVPVPTSLSVAASAVTMDAIGDTALLVATVSDQNGDPIPGSSVTWTSLNTSIVTVNATSGLATAVAPGTADVRAAFDTLVATVAVTVAPVPTQLAKVAGDQQTGALGATLSTSLTVQVKDRLGAGVAGVTVIFAVTQGGGSVGTISVLSAATGLAATAWTLGGSPGANQATASLSSGSVAAVTFTATAINLGITNVTPDPLVEGQSATITGVGFDPVAANNTVRIGGAVASVTSASATTLVATVGTTDCMPAQSIPVTVTVAGVTSAPFSRTRQPAVYTNLAIGQQQVLRSPSDLCVQLAGSSTSEAYLVGIQSTTEAASSLTPATVSAAVATAAAVPPLLSRGEASRVARALPEPDVERARRWARHREAESALRQRERALSIVSREGAARRLAANLGIAAQIPPVVNVGDVLSIKVPNIGVADFCTNFTSISAVVRVIGTRGVWLEDAANPSGFSVADFQALSNQLDNPIYDTDVAYFGAPSDLDGNSRIAVVVTKEVNRIQGGFILGFVVNTDLGACASSNGGEIYYAKAPDAAGTFGLAYSVADARADAPFLIAHEFSHIIQFSRRLAVGAPNMSVWTAEGQATLAEEVVGHAVESRAAGQNLGFNVAFNQDDPASTDWYSGAFATLARYYGYNGAAPTVRVVGAPEECSFVTTSGPCTEGAVIYGASWSLLRWISDHFGPGFPGGEQGLHQALVSSTSSGYANITSVVGASMDSLLPQWAAMLYVDDRVAGAAARLTLPSWNLLDIEGRLVTSAQLAPRLRSFAAFSDNVNVRSGSSAYFRVGGGARSATAIKARASGGGSLPSTMQMWVVRLQ